MSSSTLFDFSDQGFDNIIVKEEDELGLIQLRTNVNTKEEAMRWKYLYFDKSNTCFNQIEKYDVIRSVFHARFCCIFGDRRHKGIRKTNTGCGVTMNIKIKRVTKDTAKRDKQVRTHPCIVTIRGKHNHTSESATSLQQLRVLPDTVKEFYKYFDAGMNPSQAIKYHQEKLNRNVVDPANNAKNPVKSSIYYHHYMWLKQNHDGGGSTSFSDETSVMDSKESLINSSFYDFCEAFSNAYSHFADSETSEAIGVILKQFKAVKSSSELNILLSSIGSSSDETENADQEVVVL